MALNAIGKVYKMSNKNIVVYIPHEIRSDSRFRFVPDEKVKISINRNGGLLVSKIPLS